MSIGGNGCGGTLSGWPVYGKTYLDISHPINANGTINEWCISTGATGFVKLKIFRGDVSRGGPGASKIFDSGWKSINTIGINYFTMSGVAVQAGDYVAFYTDSPNLIIETRTTGQYVADTGDVDTFVTEYGAGSVSLLGGVSLSNATITLRNNALNQGKTNIYRNNLFLGTLNANDSQKSFNFATGDTFRLEAIGSSGPSIVYLFNRYCDEVNTCVSVNPYSRTLSGTETAKTWTVYFYGVVPSTTLSLNTSVSSSHKVDFYSSGGKINNVYANFFTNMVDCPTTDWNWYKRIESTQEWKLFNTFCCTDFSVPPCHSSSYLATIDNTHLGQFIDKIAVEFNGLRAESWVNRCNVHITAKKSVDNTPLKDVEIYREPAVNSSDFIVYRCSNLCNTVICPTPPCGSDIESIRIPLINCNTSVDLMKTKVRNDVVLVGTLGIPNKLTWTTSTPGVYSGTLNWQYWNGAEWTYFPSGTGGIVDETNGFKNSGANNVFLPAVSDWQRRQIMQEWETGAFYWCRAVYDSDLSVTTVPQASCLKWSGQYVIITDTNGESRFTVQTNQQTTFKVPGKLPGYICQTGCPISGYTLNEGTSNFEVNTSLIATDLICTDVTKFNLKYDTPIYQNSPKILKVTSNVSYGSIRNELKITDPDKIVVLTKTDIPMGTDVPVTFTYIKVGLYKIELTTKDDGDNTCKKTAYAYALAVSPCNTWTDQSSCESHGCYWTGSNCIDNDPKARLRGIYDDIIAGRKCIDSTCVPILDLNNDTKIDINDKNLVDSLTSTQAQDKIFNYEICDSIYPYPCHSGGGGGGSGGGGGGLIVVAILLGLGLGYIVLKKKNESGKKKERLKSEK